MAEEITFDDAYYIQLGKQAAAAKEAEVPQASTPAPAPLVFGPMQPATPAPVAPPVQSSEDALIARILAAIQRQQGQPAAPAAPVKPLSKEDQRVHDEMARLFPTGRDLAVNSRLTLGANLFLIEVGYTPHSGVRYSERMLVLDDGNNPIVVWRAD